MTSPCACEGTAVLIPQNTTSLNRRGVQGDSRLSLSRRATLNDPFKDFKRLYEEGNIIQSSGLEGAGTAFWKRRWKVDGSICLPHMLGRAGGEICLSTAGVITKFLYHISERSVGERIACVFIKTALLFKQKGLRRVLNI